MKKGLSILSLLLVFVAFLSAQEISVSVIPLSTSSGVGASELGVITEYLESGLINTGKFNVIASKQRDAILGEQRFALSGCTDQSCALEIGKLLSAQYMIFGVVNRNGNEYIISVKKVNVETSRIEANAISSIVSLSTTQIQNTTLKLAHQLAGLSYVAETEQIAAYTGSLRIRVNPTNATAVFNLSTVVKTFPTVLEDIPVGEYPVRISLDGFETELMSVRVEKGKTAEVNVTLKRVSGPVVRPPVGQGFLTIYSSPPGMQVEIDYEILDMKTPIENLPLPTGEHMVVVGDFINSYFKDKETYVTVEAGKTVDLPIELERNNGNLMIVCSVEDAVVYINGKSEGTVKGGRCLVRNIPAGRIELTVSRNRYYPDTREMDLRPGQTTEVSAQIKPMPVRVIIDSNPSGAEVFFDRRSIGKTPSATENVEQGSHLYYLVFNGYTTGIRTLDVTGTEDRTITEDLTATLTITLNDPLDREAEVLLDGRYVGETSNGELRLQSVNLGRHDIELRKEGFGTVKKSITLPEAGYKLAADLRLQDISFSVVTEPGGAEVLVDGAIQEGLTPMTLRLSEGRHEVIIRKKGYLPVTEAITVDSPRGMRIRKALVEGEDAGVLAAYYRDAVEELERPHAGILSCGVIAKELGKLETELACYAIDVSGLSAFLAERKNYYVKRASMLTTVSVSIRDRINELNAGMVRLERRKKGLLWGEIASITGSLACGTGAYFAYGGMMDYYTSYTEAGLTVDAQKYRALSQTFGWLSYAGIGVSISGIVTAIILPGKIADTRADIEKASREIAELAGILARIEITRNAEGDVLEDMEPYLTK